jgi:LCP family protein required for cell wall assembly
VKERVKQRQTVIAQTEGDRVNEQVSQTTQAMPKHQTSFFRRGFWWGIAFALTATVSATVGATLAVVSPLSSLITPLRAKGTSFIKDSAEQNLGWGSLFQYQLSRPVNILIMGIDRVPEAETGSKAALSGRSDTILLVRFDPTDETISLVSVPRDSRVRVPGLGMTKINDANVEGGAVLAAEVVSKTLNDVPIDRYVRVTTEALPELIDLVGGVEVFVPEAMQYEDRSQGLYIDLEPGWQTLNGDEAEQFSRFRGASGGDIGRVQRQQILLKALRRRLQSPAILPKIPKLVRMMQQYVDTNLSFEEILAVVNYSKDIDADQLQMVLLPGRFSRPDEFNASYWILDEEGRDRVTTNYLDQAPTETTDSRRRNRRNDTLQIAVQNATDSPNLATEVTRMLSKDAYYDPYVVPDSPMLLQETEIIAQRGDLEAANNLKKQLGFGRVEASSTGEINSELTLRLGEDAVQVLR